MDKTVYVNGEHIQLKDVAHTEIIIKLLEKIEENTRK
jgi:hypothetical protein